MSAPQGGEIEANDPLHLFLRGRVWRAIIPDRTLKRDLDTFHTGWIAQSQAPFWATTFNERATMAQLSISDAGISVDCVVPAEGVRPGKNAAPAIFAAMPANVLQAFGGQTESFASISDVLRHLYTSFDKDIAGEYDTELAEASADLGFDVEKDFLANIGQEWAAAETKEGMADILFSVRDEAAFKRQAARLAEVGKEPWTVAGEVFKTRAYGVPLSVEVKGGRVAITNAEGMSRDLGQRPAGVLPASMPFKAPDDREESIAFTYTSYPARKFKPKPDRMAAILLRMEWAPPFGNDGALWTQVCNGSGYRRVRLGTSGVSLNDLRSALEPILAELDRPHVADRVLGRPLGAIP
jgi:hypothetical protein